MNTKFLNLGLTYRAETQLYIPLYTGGPISQKKKKKEVRQIMGLCVNERALTVKMS